MKEKKHIFAAAAISIVLAVTGCAQFGVPEDAANVTRTNTRTAARNVNRSINRKPTVTRNTVNRGVARNTVNRGVTRNTAKRPVRLTNGAGRTLDASRRYAGTYETRTTPKSNNIVRTGRTYSGTGRYNNRAAGGYVNRGSGRNSHTDINRGVSVMPTNETAIRTNTGNNLTAPVNYGTNKGINIGNTRSATNNLQNNVTGAAINENAATVPDAAQKTETVDKTKKQSVKRKTTSTAKNNVKRSTATKKSAAASAAKSNTTKATTIKATRNKATANKTNTANVNTANVNTANVNTANVNTANTNTANANLTNVNTANTNTANANIANTNTVTSSAVRPAAVKKNKANNAVRFNKPVTRNSSVYNDYAYNEGRNSSANSSVTRQNVMTGQYPSIYGRKFVNPSVNNNSAFRSGIGRGNAAYLNDTGNYNEYNNRGVTRGVTRSTRGSADRDITNRSVYNRNMQRPDTYYDNLTIDNSIRNTGLRNYNALDTGYNYADSSLSGDFYRDNITRSQYANYTTNNLRGGYGTLDRPNNRSFGAMERDRYLSGGPTMDSMLGGTTAARY